MAQGAAGVDDERRGRARQRRRCEELRWQGMQEDVSAMKRVCIIYPNARGNVP